MEAKYFWAFFIIALLVGFAIGSSVLTGFAIWQWPWQQAREPMKPASTELKDKVGVMEQRGESCMECWRRTHDLWKCPQCWAEGTGPNVNAVYKGKVPVDAYVFDTVKEARDSIALKYGIFFPLEGEEVTKSGDKLMIKTIDVDINGVNLSKQKIEVFCESPGTIVEEDGMYYCTSVMGLKVNGKDRGMMSDLGVVASAKEKQVFSKMQTMLDLETRKTLAEEEFARIRMNLLGFGFIKSMADEESGMGIILAKKVSIGCHDFRGYCGGCPRSTPPCGCCLEWASVI